MREHTCSGDASSLDCSLVGGRRHYNPISCLYSSGCCMKKWPRRFRRLIYRYLCKKDGEFGSIWKEKEEHEFDNTLSVWAKTF